MAINAQINVQSGVGKATINQSTRTKIVAQNFNPQPNVNITQVGGVSTGGVTNGQTLVFNSSTGQFEANTVPFNAINGGSF
jgi:chorismate synthase